MEISLALSMAKVVSFLANESRQDFTDQYTNKITDYLEN